jgi:hypothetical protein
MNSPRPARPLLFLYFFRLFAVLGAVPFLINTVDILLHFPAPSLDPTFDPVMRFLLGLVVAPLTLIIAGLCIRRAPGNLIGWMLVSFGYGASVQVMRANLLPLGFAVVIANFSIGVFWFGFLLTPLYFPDGQLYPARANRWGNSLVSFLIFSSLVIANLCNAELTWGSGAHQVTVPNPLLVIEWNYTVVTIPMLVSLIITGIITVILRYRGSRERERLQLRWLLFGVLFQGVLTILTFWAPPGIERFSIWINTLFGLIVPLAVGIAVLRYRLYDIDLIIRRTLQYGLLTMLLGLVYFGMVVLLEQTFRAITGQESPLAVVLSTLAIAALFSPLRRRLQVIIDRRFFRQKYNAERAVATFAAAARSETALNEITGQMLSVVEETVQPEQVWVWMKDGKQEPR